MAAKDSSVVDLDDISPTHELQFRDIPHSDDSSRATTPAKEQTHTFTKFPDTAGSDEEDDKADLLKGDKPAPSFWTFEYYQQYFDVDTFQVLHRILGSMLPNPKSNYLQKHIRPNPDLYGPFWICTTLVFTTAIAGNLANYFQSIGKEYTWHYDFHKVTFAATAIYCYWWLIPTIIWGLLMWRGSQAGYTYLEMICVYGYSLAIYVPISVLWVIQVSWLQWLLVLLGMGLSGAVLVITFWPAVRDDNKKVAILTVALIVIFHGLLAIGFVLYFFHVPAANTNMTPLTNATTPALTPALLHDVMPPHEKALDVLTKHSAEDVAKAVTTTVKAVIQAAVDGDGGEEGEDGGGKQGAGQDIVQEAAKGVAKRLAQHIAKGVGGEGKVE